MELPFTVVFEPPSQAELRAVLRLRRTWLAGALAVLAIGTVCVAVVGIRRADAVAGGPPVPVSLTSRPSGAGVWLDDREVGRTPLDALVEPGLHSVLFKASDALDGRYTLRVGADPVGLDAVLWRRQPVVTRLRPTLPGAVLATVTPLPSGELALSIAVPPGPEMQAWRLDPDSGAVAPVVGGAAGTRLTVASDGRRAALVGYDIGPPSASAGVAGSAAGPANVVWLMSDGSSQPTTGWRPLLVEGEALVDASWSPHADRLLAVSGQRLTGGAFRSRVWFLDVGSQVGNPVLSLPSQVVPGSELWSPDGQHVAFVAHAGEVNALCLIDVDGSFRYVADLDSSAEPPLAFVPATWAADSQHLVFVAPHQHPPGVAFEWLQPDPRHALYVVSPTDSAPAFTADTEVDLATWREDGQLLGLGRLGADGALAVRLVGEPGSSTQHLVDLPLRPAANYAATWDLAHGRLLVANPTPSGGVDYWLALLGV